MRSKIETELNSQIYCAVKMMMMIVTEVKMQIKKKNVMISSLLTLFLFNTPLFAHAGSNPLSPGAWVAEENRISLLDSGQNKGNWQTRDLSIEYEFLPEERSIQIAVVVELANHITTSFSSLEHLTIYIHVLKADGFVEDIIRIKTFGYRQRFDLIGRMAFDSRMDLSEDSVAIAFSYNGTVSQGGGAYGVDFWNIWKVPHRSPPA